MKRKHSLLKVSVFFSITCRGELTKEVLRSRVNPLFTTKGSYMQSEDLFAALKRLQRVALADEEIYALQAKIAMKSFSAFQKEGFTREEALHLAIGAAPIRLQPDVT